MRSRLVLFGAGALVTAATLSGCSASELDVDKLESTISTEMQSQLGLDAAPTVTCPDPIPIEQGQVSTCTAELDGESVNIEVTQDDDQGNVTWQVV